MSRPKALPSSPLLPGKTSAAPLRLLSVNIELQTDQHLRSASCSTCYAPSFLQLCGSLCSRLPHLLPASMRGHFESFVRLSMHSSCTRVSSMTMQERSDARSSRSGVPAHPCAI